MKRKRSNKNQCWRRALEDSGLKVSRLKTDYLSFNHESVGDVRLEGNTMKRVHNFKYLGSTVAENGDLDREITHRIQAGWKNWKMSGVLWDKRIHVRVKGKVFKTVVSPVMLYCAEMWGSKRAQEKRLDVAEMKLLRFAFGATKIDRIRNERIMGTTKVMEISKKVLERSLQWYGHVMRKDEDYVGKRVMEMEVPGRRKRGRPNRGWLDSVKVDLKEKGLEGNEFHNRARWKQLVKNIDPA